MTDSRIITIVGVTGNQGSAVAKTFLQKSGWHVRGLTRSATSSAAKIQARAGVKLVKADLDDKSSLVEAFKDSHAIYANTDFFALTKRPDLGNLLATTYAGKPLNRACMEHEAQQGRKIIDAAAKVLSEGSPLESFVLSTLSHASKWSDGAITQLLHFDSKWIVENYLRTQYPALAAKTRYLQVGFYMSNILFPFLIPGKNEDGTYDFRWANIDPSTVLPATCPEQDAGVFVHALVSAPSRNGIAW